MHSVAPDSEPEREGGEVRFLSDAFCFILLRLAPPVPSDVHPPLGLVANRTCMVEKTEERFLVVRVRSCTYICIAK